MFRNLIFRNLIVPVALPALAAFAVAAPVRVFCSPIPSTYTLIGTPVVLVPPGAEDVNPVVPSPIILQVSLKPLSLAAVP
jgi:hypothetical protein